jgi:CHAT domain-containing protein
VLSQLADRELVLVPTGELHAMPWAALPTCSARAVSVAPSAALWLRAARRRAPRAEDSASHAGARGRAAGTAGALVLVAGPGLPEAAAEVRALAGRHPRATVLQHADATVTAVAVALEAAALAHIACHGTFRADNPLFSALELADGPLTVYDLERLSAAPQDMILSACDGGVTAVRPGDELMGFSGALLALGTSALIASVVPVPDEPTHRLMLALHQRLAEGCDPAPALALARADAIGDGGADYATAAGFVCFGAGSPATPEPDTTITPYGAAQPHPRTAPRHAPGPARSRP